MSTTLRRMRLLVCAALLACVPTVFGCGGGAPTPPPAGVGITGTWTTSLDFGGSVRPFTLQLHQRSNGRVYGYVLGGTDFRKIPDASVSGSNLTLLLDLEDAQGLETWWISASIAGGTMTGTARGGNGTQPVTLTQQSGVFHERRFVFAVLDSEGEPTDAAQLAVVHDDAGAFVSGGFVGGLDAESLGCNLFACSGGVTSLTEVGNALTIGLETDGGCSAGSSLTASFDPMTLFYDGSYTFTDCAGTTAGTLVGVRSVRTRSDHVAAILAALASLADGLDAAAPLLAPYPALSAAYLHDGRGASLLADDWNAEIADYTDITALFVPRRIHTVADALALPDLIPVQNVWFEQARTGIAAGAMAPQVYLDSTVTPFDDRMGIWREEAGAWRIYGNQFAPLPFPFANTFATSRVEVPTPGGTVYVSIGPYGSHDGPWTGHANGDAKANLVGFVAEGDADLTELEGDMDGVREPGEVWGYWGGPSGDLVRNKNIVYTAPRAGTITAVTYSAAPVGAGSIYLDDPPHWEVELDMGSNITLRLGHCGRIASNLRDKVLLATGVDTDTYAGPIGANVLGSMTVVVAAGEQLCHPQMPAQELAAHPGYYVGHGGFPVAPWNQMEWNIVGPIGPDQRADNCYYDYMSDADRATLQALLDADIADAASWRYSNVSPTDAWRWRAEGRLCMAHSPAPRDFSALYSSLGGWFEANGPATTSDELFAFYPIAKDVAAYSPALYDSAAVSHLVTRRRVSGSGPWSWTMPDASTAMPFYPVGEVLELTASTMLLKWRDIGYAPGGVPTPVYQRMTYILGDTGLKVRWGSFAAAPAGAAAPALVPSDPCTDTDAICYDHEHKPGY